MTESRTIEILAQKLAQAEANHAYVSALLEVAQQREREELRQLEARVRELEGGPKVEATPKEHH